MGGFLHLIQRVGDWAQAPPRRTKCNINGQCTNQRIAV